jgi:hypothetical protein
VPQGQRLVPFGDGVVHAGLRVQGVAALVHVGELHRLAQAQPSRVRGLLPGDHAEERGLAGPVGADHPHDPSRRQVEGEVVEEERVPVGLAETLRLHHHPSQARTGRDVDLLGLDALGGVLGQQLLVGADAGLALGMAGARGHAHPFQLALQRALPRALLLLLLGEAVSLLVEPGGVVPFPGDAGAAVELEDPARHVVEEVAVVGDRHHRPLVVVQEVLEPGHGLGIEVVRGLVQQQQVRLLEQQPAEGDAPALAARQVLHGGVGGGQRRASIAVSSVRSSSQPVDRLDLLLDLGLLLEELLHLVGLERLGEAVADPVERIEERLDLPHPFLDHLQHGLVGIELGLLVEVAHLDPLGGERLSR